MKFKASFLKSFRTTVCPTIGSVAFRKADSLDHDFHKTSKHFQLSGYLDATKKADGDRMVVYKDANSAVWCLKTSGACIAQQLWKAKPLWLDAIIQMLPPGEWIDGELCSGDGRESVSTAIAQGLPTEFYGFGCSWHTNTAQVDEVNRAIKLVGIQTLPSFTVKVEDGVLTDLLADAKDQGIEGYVLKQSHYGRWWKLKVERTIDLVVTGTVDGKNAHTNKVGALLCSAEGIELCSAGGMSLDARNEMSLNDPIGRVAEIKYQRAGSQGRLLHPRFLRWRDDKPAADCLLDQDPELARIWKKGAYAPKGEFWDSK